MKMSLGQTWWWSFAQSTRLKMRRSNAHLRRGMSRLSHFDSETRLLFPMPMSSPKPNRVVVLVEHLFIPEEIDAYRETFESNGFVFEAAARLWGKDSDTFYS